MCCQLLSGAVAKQAIYMVVRGEQLESSNVQAYLLCELDVCPNVVVVLDLGLSFVSDGGELWSFPWTSRLPLHLMNTDEERNITSVVDE